MLVDNFVLQENALTLHEYCRPQGRIKRSKHLPLRLQFGQTLTSREQMSQFLSQKCKASVAHKSENVCNCNLDPSIFLPPSLVKEPKHSKHLIPGLWRRSLNYNMIDAILMAGINELLCMKRARQLGLLNQDFLPLFIFVAGI